MRRGSEREKGKCEVGEGGKGRGKKGERKAIVWFGQKWLRAKIQLTCLSA